MPASMARRVELSEEQEADAAEAIKVRGNGGERRGCLLAALLGCRRSKTVASTGDVHEM